MVNEVSSGTVLDVDFVLIRIHLHENQLVLFFFGIGLDSLTVEESFDRKQHRKKVEVLDFEDLVLAIENVREGERDEEY